MDGAGGRSGEVVRLKKHGGAPTEARCHWAFFAIVALIVLALVAVDESNTRYVDTVLTAYVDWTSTNLPWSLALYLFTTMIVILATLPASVLVVGAGVIFPSMYGYGAGIVLAVLGMGLASVLAAVIALIIGRFLLRSKVQNILQTDDRFRLVRAADKLMASAGVEMTIVLKVAIPLPIGLHSYILGCTPVSVAHFAIATAIFQTPLYFFIVLATASAAQSAELLSASIDAPAHATCAGLLLLVAFALVVWFGLNVKQRYAELLAILEADCATRLTADSLPLTGA